MTERTSQNKQILEKLDILTTELFNLKGDIASIQKQIEMQPKIDQQSFDGLKQQNVNCQASNNTRFVASEQRIDKLEENQSWFSKAIIGTVIGLVITTLYSITKGL